jgi:hypothetical protein
VRIGRRLRAGKSGAESKDECNGKLKKCAHNVGEDLR